MAGALGLAAGIGGDDDADLPALPDTSALSGPASLYSQGQYDPLLSSDDGGIRMQPPGPYSPSSGILNLRKVSESLTGADPIAPLNAAQKSKNQALDWKKQKIQEAFDRLSRTGPNAQGATNLPMLMAGSAMLQPSRDFFSSLGNAGAAAAQAIGQQREQDRTNALTLSQLGIEGADVDVARADSDIGMHEKLLDFGLKAGEQATRTEAYEQAGNDRAQAGWLRYVAAIKAAKERAEAQKASAASRADAQRDVANIQAKWQIKRTDVMADKNRYTFAGNTQDGTSGQWVDRSDPDSIKNPLIGPPVAPKTPAGRTANLVDELMKDVDADGHPLYRTTSEAVAFLHKPTRVPEEESRLTAARERLANSDAQLDQGYQADPTGTIKRYRVFYGLPAAPPAVHQAAPVGRPAPRAINGVNPNATTPSLIPPRPASAPANAQYSAKTKAYWWKDSSGNWRNAPVQ